MGSGGGGEPCLSRRALHLPGCSKFEPFNTTSSGKLAANNVQHGRAATACSNCSGGSHGGASNSRPATGTVTSSFNPAYNVDLGGGVRGHNHINGDLRNRGVLKNLAVQGKDMCDITNSALCTNMESVL